MASNVSSPKQWHIGNWTGLGWLETGIKLVAQVVAFVAIAWAIRPWDLGIWTTDFRLWPDIYLIRVLILGVITLALTANLENRFREKELVSTILGLINVVAHWGLIFSLWRQPGPSGLLSLINYQPQHMLPWNLFPIFCLFMMVGEGINVIGLFRTTDSSHRMPMYISSGFVLWYGALLFLCQFNPFI